MLLSLSELPSLSLSLFFFFFFLNPSLSQSLSLSLWLSDKTSTFAPLLNFSLALLVVSDDKCFFFFSLLTLFVVPSLSLSIFLSADSHLLYLSHNIILHHFFNFNALPFKYISLYLIHNTLYITNGVVVVVTQSESST